MTVFQKLDESSPYGKYLKTMHDNIAIMTRLLGESTDSLKEVGEWLDEIESKSTDDHDDDTAKVVAVGERMVEANGFFESFLSSLKKVKETVSSDEARGVSS